MSTPAPEIGKPGRPKKGAPDGVKQWLLLRPILEEICGDRGAALFLSQALNLSDARQEDTGCQAAPVPDATAAEFTYTHQAWEATTGLSRDQQQAARQILRGLGFLRERRHGMPGRLYYAVDREALMAAVALHIKTREQA